MPNPEPTRLDAAEIEAIRQREVDATPGPWTAEEDGYMGHTYYETTRYLTCGGDLDGASEEDINFITHAREDVPRLLATIEAQTKENALLRAQMPVVAQTDWEAMRHRFYQCYGYIPTDDDLLRIVAFVDSRAQVEKEMNNDGN